MSRNASLAESEAVQLLTDLVAIPSPSGAERQASSRLVSWMAGHGFDARVDPVGNAVGVRGSGPREVLLLGHIDTFPGVIPVRREGKLLYGRGSVDAKGSLCAFAAAAAAVSVPPAWRVSVVGAVEEEAATSAGARHIVASRAQGTSDGAPAYCIIGEPSRWDRLTVGYRGRIVFEIALRAPFAHSAGAERLPAERGVALWAAVERYCAEWNQAHGAGDWGFEAVSPSLRSFVTSDDGAFGTARLQVGVRLPLAARPAVIERELIRRLKVCEPDDEAPADQAPSARGGELRITTFGGEPAYRAGKSNPLVRAFLAEIRGAGGAPKFVVKTGTSDMNIVGPAWPLTPVVAYGPGDSALDHTPGERLDLDEYVRSVRVLASVLQRLLGGESRAGAPRPGPASEHPPA